MAARRKRTDLEPRTGALDERRRLWAAGSLFGAVIVVLILGAILRSSDPIEASPAMPVRSPTTTLTPAPAPAPSSRPEAPGTDVAERDRPQARREASDEPAARPVPRGTLASRAAADRTRLVRSGGSYTVQLMVACDPDNATRVVDDAGGTDRLYVLPMTHDGKACYRLCWGSYPSRQSAESAGDLPGTLRDRFPTTRVRAVGDLTS